MLVTKETRETDGELLTVGEVAKRLRVTELTVRRWLTSGRLKGLQVAGKKTRWRIPASELAGGSRVGSSPATAADNE